MKVVIVNRHYTKSLGGSEIQCHQIATRLTQLGEFVTYVALGGAEENKSFDYPIVQCKETSTDIKSVLTRQTADVVYWRYNKSFLAEVMKTLKRLETPLVFSVSHIHDIKPFAYKPIPGLSLYLRSRRALGHLVKGWFYRKALRQVSGVVCNNREHLDLVRHNHKKYIPNTPYIESTGFIWPRPYVVWVGNLKQHKHPEDYIRLAEELDDSGVDFLLVGKIQQSAYQYLEDSSNTPSNFYYLGSKGILETNGVIKNSLMLIHTCEPEGFPNVFLQAWGFKKPVLSMQFDPEQILAKHGLGAHSGSFEQLVKDCRFFIENMDEREQVGEKASQYLERKFVLDKNVDELLSFLKSVTAK